MSSTTPMNDFLRARLTERLEAAEEALTVASPYGEGFTLRWGWSLHTKHTSGGYGTQFVDGAPTPRQVIADCRAKLALIDVGFAWAQLGVPAEQLATLAFAVTSLAHEWADHPDFDPAWVAR